MKPRNIAMYILGGAFVLEYFVILTLLIFYEIPVANEKILTFALGTLTGGAMSIINYFYGSSAGSAQKTEIMANGKKPE